MMEQFECPLCGYIHEAKSIPYGFKCPVCHTDGSRFKEKAASKNVQKTDTDFYSYKIVEQTKKTLTSSECKEYVRNIKNLEVSCYQLERLQDNLKRELRKAEVRKQALSTEKIEEPSQDNIIKDLFLSVAAGLYYGTVPGIVLGFIFGITSVDRFFQLAFTLVGIFSGLIATFFFLISLIESRNYKKQNQEKREKYEIAKQRHAQNTNYNNARLQLIPAEIEKCDAEYKKTRDLLKQYYNMNFIYPKYRGMVPICTIYEYLESGRCFSLIGHEGAYNLYESELRMNLIIEKLDDIIYRLDDIQSSQKMLVNEIKRSNAMIDNLCSSIDNIEQNTALTQYYSKVTATNTSYLAWLAYLDQKSVL